MRNADILPPVTSSYFFNLGNNEIEMPSLQASTQMESIINVHGHDYPLESKIYNDAYQPRDGALANIPYQSSFGSLHDYQSSSSNFNTTLYQQSTVLSTKPALPQFQWDLQNNVANARKRSTDEVNEILGLPLDEASDLVGDMTGRKMKKKKVSLPEEKQSYQVQESAADIKERKVQAPVRRSQKLSDKITALQKLVSPYGKTDTASVLQEASLYIKLLQEQIQNLFQMLSRTYNSFGALHSERVEMKLDDLRSRGLCLVPISDIQKVAKEEQISTYDAMSRTTFISRN